jgi:hypothetical protein
VAGPALRYEERYLVFGVRHLRDGCTVAALQSDRPAEPVQEGESGGFQAHPQQLFLGAIGDGQCDAETQAEGQAVDVGDIEAPRHAAPHGDCFEQ